MSKIFELNSEIDLETQILWQYANSDKLNTLLQQKQAWYKEYQEGFWADWADNILNISTANDFGLSIWGNLLQVSRTYDIDGVMKTLDTEQYRLLLKGRLLYLKMNGSVPDINEYLNLMFESIGQAYIRDNLDMSITYILSFTPTEDQFAVLLNTSVLPRPAGVRYKIYILPDDDIFGFEQSDWTGFDQSPFWNGVDAAE